MLKFTEKFTPDVAFEIKSESNELCIVDNMFFDLEELLVFNPFTGDVIIEATSRQEIRHFELAFTNVLNNTSISRIVDEWRYWDGCVFSYTEPTPGEAHSRLEQVRLHITTLLAIGEWFLLLSDYENVHDVCNYIRSYIPDNIYMGVEYDESWQKIGEELHTAYQDILARLHTAETPRQIPVQLSNPHEQSVVVYTTGA